MPPRRRIRAVPCRAVPGGRTIRTRLRPAPAPAVLSDRLIEAREALPSAMPMQSAQCRGRHPAGRAGLAGASCSPSPQRRGMRAGKDPRDLPPPPLPSENEVTEWSKVCCPARAPPGPRQQ